MQLHNSVSNLISAFSYLILIKLLFSTSASLVLWMQRELLPIMCIKGDCTKAGSVQLYQSRQINSKPNWHLPKPFFKDLSQSKYLERDDYPLDSNLLEGTGFVKFNFLPSMGLYF